MEELKVTNDVELFEVLKERVNTKWKYDNYRFEKTFVDYRDIEALKFKLDYIDKLVDDYLKISDYKKIICKEDTIIRPDGRCIYVPSTVDDESYEDVRFDGIIARRSRVDLFYKENHIFARNDVRPRDMKNPSMSYIERYCKIGNHVCFAPGNYMIKEGDTIALAKQKVLTK